MEKEEVEEKVEEVVMEEEERRRRVKEEEDVEDEEKVEAEVEGKECDCDQRQTEEFQWLQRNNKRATMMKGEASLNKKKKSRNKQREIKKDGNER